MIKLLASIILAIAIILNGVYAGDGQPIVTEAVDLCDRTFLIQVFPDGLVKYTGVRGVKQLGRHEKRINPAKLITKIFAMRDAGELGEDIDRLVTLNRIPELAITTEYGALLNHKAFLSFFVDILHATQLESWARFKSSDLDTHRFLEKIKCPPQKALPGEKCPLERNAIFNFQLKPAF